MRTSLNDIRAIENHLLNMQDAEEAAVLEARSLTDPLFRMNIFFQKKLYTLLGIYHRKKIKEEVEAVHEKLFTDPSRIVFQQRIMQCFKK